MFRRFASNGTPARRRIATSAIALWAAYVMVAGRPASIAAQGIVDQQSCVNQNPPTMTINSSTEIAQSFVPGRAGLLRRVSIPSGVHNSGTTTLHIRQNYGKTGRPDGHDLAAASITTSGDFIFTPGVNLSAGESYSLVMTNSGGSYTWPFSNVADCYLLGVGSQASITSDNLKIWSFFDGNGPSYPYPPSSLPRDFYFQTFIDDATPIADQASCSTSTNATATGSTWLAETFVPAVNQKLTTVTLSGVHNSGITFVSVFDTSLMNGNPPFGGPLATSLGTSTSFPFSGLTLEGGRRYAIVVSNPGGSFTWSRSTTSGCYANGSAFTSGDSGQSWTAQSFDYGFTTWVVSLRPVRDQFTSCLRINTQLMQATSTTWRAQIFVAGTTGRLSRVELPGSTNTGGLTDAAHPWREHQRRPDPARLGHRLPNLGRGLRFRHRPGGYRGHAVCARGLQLHRWFPVAKGGELAGRHQPLLRQPERRLPQ